MAHLTSEQRYTIGIMLKAGEKKSKILNTIGKHPSVIGREIRRNKDGQEREVRQPALKVFKRTTNYFIS